MIPRVLHSGRSSDLANIPQSDRGDKEAKKRALRFPDEMTSHRAEDEICQPAFSKRDFSMIKLGASN
ncbi:hypothetical protein TNIN_375901 [Trichonephila inaurata madagascariensis]|uniref:Uncharacterized protein n=1 Tax=Trichonephila inaurata madagascariensis TaxID=2747483 RepID=A0A8X6Y180_9ARAC|nr:hypothetical protein TNIN_375901 [Trichonephila inaurata madagascariensis]